MSVLLQLLVVPAVTIVWTPALVGFRLESRRRVGLISWRGWLPHWVARCAHRLLLLLLLGLLLLLLLGSLQLLLLLLLFGFVLLDHVVDLLDHGHLLGDYLLELFDLLRLTSLKYLPTGSFTHIEMTCIGVVGLSRSVVVLPASLVLMLGSGEAGTDTTSRW